MPLIIRKAIPEDAPLISTLGATSYRYHFQKFWQSEDELQAFIEGEYSLPTLAKSLSDPDVGWFIAENKGAIGFAKISWDRSVPGRPFSGALLNKLYFAPGETGKGYGKALFDRAIELAKERNQNYFWLEVLEGNEGARNFYLSQGMSHLTSETFTSATQTSTLYILGKPL
ncbi:GNAT family N-acetyltransferase [Cedecea davisae]|uniref:GNAT family N-acetyltransferase n=1 Tax=Cedecea davisae TaxID=158484 RepID=UPI00242E1E43|nr:GNAT family N-acetyltransferase [Cedecea davisae]